MLVSKAKAEREGDLHVSIADPDRLEALRKSGLLRHDLEKRLDILCETATELIGCPVSYINLLDDQLQHTVGSFPIGPRKSNPVETTGCEEVVIAEKVIVVPDTRDHPVMCMRPFVTVAGMLAYLGVPILFGEQVVGSFCVLDYEPRDWAHWQVEALKGLASLTSAAALR
jgi:GAF domain-containing protein